MLNLSPHHLIDDTRIALNDFHYLGGDILITVGRYGNCIITGDTGDRGQVHVTIPLYKL